MLQTKITIVNSVNRVLIERLAKSLECIEVITDKLENPIPWMGITVAESYSSPPANYCAKTKTSGVAGNTPPVRLDCTFHSLEKTLSTMDIEQKRRLRERLLLTLVGIMAVLANLPAHVLDSVGIQRQLALAIFGLVVFLALFLYVRLFFFVLYLLLAIGANLPEQWAAALHISTLPLLIALVFMVALSLLNYSAKVLPSGLEPTRKKQNPEATKALLNAIERRSVTQVRSILSMDFDINGTGSHGETPLMHAAQLGDKAIVELLLAAGAELDTPNAAGNAEEIATAAGHPDIRQLLAAERARRAASAKPTAKSGASDATDAIDSTL
jgi:hypothetical protein